MSGSTQRASSKRENRPAEGHDRTEKIYCCDDIRRERRTCVHQYITGVAKVKNVSK